MLPMPTLNTYVDPHLVSNTPSRASGIDEETETALRIYGCELIQEAGVLLRLYPYAHGCGDGILHKDCDSYRPQVTMATGQVLFHRFYYRKSFREYDVKVEESPKKVRDVINVYHHLTQKRDGNPKPEPLDTNKQLYWDLKNDLIKNERMILRELGFMVYVELPHKYIPNYVKALGLSNDITQQAWNFTNDSLRTNVCVRYKPGQIAAAAIFMAARLLQIKLPGPPFPWWELFDCVVDDEICIAIASLYKRSKATYIDVQKIPIPTPVTVTPPREARTSPTHKDSRTPSSQPSTKTPPASTETNGTHKTNGAPKNPTNISSPSSSSPSSPSPSSSSSSSGASKNKAKIEVDSRRDNDRHKDGRNGSARDDQHRSKEDKRDNRGRDYDGRERERERERDRERDRRRGDDRVHRHHHRDSNRRSPYGR